MDKGKIIPESDQIEQIIKTLNDAEWRVFSNALMDMADRICKFQQITTSRKFEKLSSSIIKLRK